MENTLSVPVLRTSIYHSILGKYMLLNLTRPRIFILGHMLSSQKVNGKPHAYYFLAQNPNLSSAPYPVSIRDKY